MMAKRQSSRKKVGWKAMQRKVAKNLLAGMGRGEALRAAGYTKMTADKKAYDVIRLPYVQSILTDACERVLAKANKQFDDVLQPFVDALSAPMIVKSVTEGIACIARDPDTQAILPDHAIRMKAAEHLVNLHQLKAAAEPPPPPPPSQAMLNWQDMPAEERQQLREKIAAVIREHLTAPKVLNGRP